MPAVLPRTVAIWAGILALATASASASASLAATVRTDRGCYLVGQPVVLTGSGFAPDRGYDVTIDGVDFGQATTTTAGTFTASLVPGGLGAGIVQSVDQLTASDGTAAATTTFTLSRGPGARFLALSGNPNTLRAPFQVWGFSVDGRRRTVFLHYVAPGGRARKTVSLGRTGGQCGYLMTGPRLVFPFSPAPGRWTLQIDARRKYRRHGPGPVARITVAIS